MPSMVIWTDETPTLSEAEMIKGTDPETVEPFEGAVMDTVGGMVSAGTAKVAVTELPALTVQVPVPLHAPDQPVNVELEDGMAYRVTDVPCGIFWLEQMTPQFIIPFVPQMEPEP